MRVGSLARLSHMWRRIRGWVLIVLGLLGALICTWLARTKVIDDLAPLYPSGMTPVTSAISGSAVLLNLGACMFAGLVGWALARKTAQMSRPPQRVFDERGSLPHATQDLQELLPSPELRDLPHVAAYAERMRARLESSREDRHLWEEVIEEIVEERTSELVALYEQLRRKDELSKRLLGKVLTAQEQERARLARELHDEIGQALTAIIMTTTVVENSLPPEFASGREKLANVRNIASQALNDLRGLIFDLRPEVLDDLGLALALRAQTKKHLEPLGIQVELRASGLRDNLPHEVETAVFRVVQEAITNIARHSRATQASISLTKQEGRLLVRVRDNGQGFDLTQVMNGPRQAWGLLGMEERVTLLGGKFYISTRPGAGTLLLAEIPLDGDWKSMPTKDGGQRHEQNTRVDR
ncbi:MAG: sensor histidine kinase [Anaerolineae bacterium]|nr:sensor histidine kinase [Anaerolineae bacterium]MDW8070133.1 sensor histidine kinase [Anaerolineae bacterium]